MTPDTKPSLWRLDGRLPRILFAAAVLLFAAGLLAGFFPAPAELTVTLRWVGLGLFIPLVAQRRSLLAWTFFAMLAGAELGVDAPQFAAQTHFLADIFLRLIRMIVAPLIFGGIVTGIAGHGKLGGVGRVALKSIVVFEGATTLGLILGAVAINFSQAGVGVTLPILSLLHAVVKILWLCALVSLLASGTLFGMSLPFDLPVWAELLLLFLIYGVIEGPLKIARRACYWGYGRPPAAWPFVLLLDALIWFAVAATLLWLAWHHFPELSQAVKSLPALVHQAADDIQKWWQAK